MVFALVLAFLSLLSPIASQDIVSQDFAKYAKGAFPYTSQMVYGDWPNVKGPLKMLAPDGSCKVNDGAIYGYFPKGKILGYDSGFTWYSELDTPMAEGTMEYDVYFQEGFDFTKGGKLPGVCGLDCPVGCSAVSPQRGWSTRLMWREGGGMVTYAYYPDKPKAIRCGEDWRWSKKVVPGRWFNVKIYTKINTPGKADGISKAYLDGELVMQKTGIMFRYNSADSYTISRAYLTTYVGGSSVEMFAPSHDQFIKFDNFKVYSGPVRSSAPVPAPRGQPPGAPAPSTSSGALQAKLTVYKTFTGGFCATVSVTASKYCSTWTVGVVSPTSVDLWGIDMIAAKLYRSNIPINQGETRYAGMCTYSAPAAVSIQAQCA